MGCKSIDISGTRYGKLTAIKLHSTSRSKHERWVCKCDCGNECHILKTHLRQGNTKSCGCDKPQGSTHTQWNGVGELSGGFWYNHVIKYANKHKGRPPIEITITKEYAWDLYVKQEGKCALSGIPIKFPKTNSDKSANISLDRIDSSKGYIEGNVHWVHKDINRMKYGFDVDYFIYLCNKISDTNNKQLNYEIQYY